MISIVCHREAQYILWRGDGMLLELEFSTVRRLAGIGSWIHQNFRG
jgi:hypothetical protein